MWLSRRRILAALGGAALVAGCGFTPVYGPRGGGARLAGQLRVDTPATREGYILRQSLEERLGRNDAGRYVLNVTPTVVQQALATSSEGTTNRYRLLGTADYTLTSVQGGQPVRQGSVTNFTGYSATGSTVATLAAERDARARLMKILAGQVVDALLITAADLPE